MTKFNPDNKEILTSGEALGPAMNITDQDDADQYLAEYIAFIQGYLDSTPNEQGLNATEIAKSNLGYWAGYGYDRERVERLFHCSHPVFGAIAEVGEPTTEEAFKMGLKLGEQAKINKL